MLKLGKNELEMFRAGDYPQGSYPPERVDRIIANFARRRHRAPIVENHDTSKGKALGYVEAVRGEWHDEPVHSADGTTKTQSVYSLIGKVRPSPAYVAGIRNNEYPALSIGLEYTGEDLNHLGALGAKSPQVKGMACPMLADERGAFSIHFDDTWMPPTPIELASGDLEADPHFDTIPGELPTDAATLRDQNIVYAVVRGLRSLFGGTAGPRITPVLSQPPAQEEDVNLEEFKTSMAKDLAEFKAGLLADVKDTLKSAVTEFAGTADARAKKAEQAMRVETLIDRLVFEGKKITAAQHAALMQIFASESAGAALVEFGEQKTPTPLVDAILQVFNMNTPLLPPKMEASLGRSFDDDDSADVIEHDPDGSEQEEPAPSAGMSAEDLERTRRFDAACTRYMKKHGCDFLTAADAIEKKHPELVSG